MAKRTTKLLKLRRKKFKQIQNIHKKLKQYLIDTKITL